MIAYLKGKLTHKEATFVIIDISGVGYQVRISLNTYTVIENKEEYQLHTYLHVREDAHTLYGFAKFDEKRLFLDLISVSGIGANTALIMLSSMSSEEIRQAIIQEDVRTIQSIKGIGGKTAQRVILELKDKLLKSQSEEVNLEKLEPNTSARTQYQVKQEALQALVELGIPKNTAEKKIDQVLKKSKGEAKVEDLIKNALKM